MMIYYYKSYLQCFTVRYLNTYIYIYSSNKFKNIKKIYKYI